MPAKKKANAKKGVIPPQLKKWMKVVKSVRDANPKLTYSEVLKKAKAIYHKSK